MENNRKSEKVLLNSSKPELQVEDKDVEVNPFIRQNSNNYYHGHR